MVALGIVFAFYLIEIAGNSVDYLTNLYSRIKMEEIIRGKIEQRRPFSVVMIDLEDFKSINDQYGHKTGDEILIHFAKVLKESFSKRSHASRIGGDEFLIACSEDTVEGIMQYRDGIKKAILDYDSYPLLQSIHFSYGASVFLYDKNLTVDTIFDHVDALMYQDKSKNKNKKRRKTDLLN